MTLPRLIAPRGESLSSLVAQAPLIKDQWIRGSGDRSGNPPAVVVVLGRGVVVVAARGAEAPRDAVGPTAPTQDTVGVASVCTAIASVTPSISVSGRSIIGSYIFILYPLPDTTSHITESLLGVPSPL